MAEGTRSSVGFKEGYADVNGVHLYYQVYGERGAATPLVLLHGGLGQIEMWGELLPQLAKGRQVIGADLQGHGRTADVDRPIRYESMADDIAGLIQSLGLSQVDVMGYSLGGGAAWQLTIRHPELVRKLVVVSGPIKRQGWLLDVLEGMERMSAQAAEGMKQSPLYQAYARVAPRREDFPVLVGKVGDLLRQEYDWSEGVRKIQAPVLIVVGDTDSVRTSHAVEMFDLLRGEQKDAGWDNAHMPRSRMAVLPGTSHYNSLESPLLAEIVEEFLGA